MVRNLRGAMPKWRSRSGGGSSAESGLSSPRPRRGGAVRREWHRRRHVRPRIIFACNAEPSQHFPGARWVAGCLGGRLVSLPYHAGACEHQENVRITYLSFATYCSGRLGGMRRTACQAGAAISRYLPNKDWPRSVLSALPGDGDWWEIF